MTQDMAQATPLRPKRLQGKVAIVTASTKGIGFAIAKRFLEEGASVVVSSRKENNVKEAVQDLQEVSKLVSGIVCHVAKQEDRQKLIQHTVEKFGHIDVLVNNAATNPVFGPTQDTSEAAWDKVMSVNVKAAFFLSLEVAKIMLEQQQPNCSIVFISSIGGLQPSPFLGAYSISKTCLFGITQTLAKEFAGRGIRVNCISPGLIKTDFSAALWQRPDATADIPLQRVGTPEDIAGVASFLVSDDASFITAENLVVSGGQAARL